jgi:putative Holliday junction resolvase
MRHLGIDYGRKRVGLALSDSEGNMAFPKAVVPNTPKLLSTLVSLIEEEEVGVVVIGHSLDQQGGDNPVQAAITELVTDLTLHAGVPVHLEPEQFSTQEATRWEGVTAEKDAAAAAIILNRYLERETAS